MIFIDNNGDLNRAEVGSGDYLNLLRLNSEREHIIHLAPVTQPGESITVGYLGRLLGGLSDLFFQP